MTRHEKSLKYAMNVLTKKYKDYIIAIYLYGSMARGEQKYISDVDLYVQVYDETPPAVIRHMKIDSGPEDYELPEVELKVSKGEEINESRTFANNIKKDGILLWERK